MSALIEDSEQIQVEYTEAANKGSTAAGAATDEVECHYVCFIKATSSELWLLDGEQDGPLSCDESCGAEADVLESPSRGHIHKFIDEHGKNASNSFAMMALIQSKLFTK